MNHYEGDNIGSLKNIEVNGANLLTGWKPAKFPPGAAWTSIPFKDESALMTFKTEETDNGPLYIYTGTFFIHNMRDEVDEILLPFCAITLGIFRITDMNDRVYIIGTPECPVSLNVSATTGQKYINENGTTFNFSVSQPTPAVSA